MAQAWESGGHEERLELSSSIRQKGPEVPFLGNSEGEGSHRTLEGLAEEWGT